MRSGLEPFLMETHCSRVQHKKEEQLENIILHAIWNSSELKTHHHHQQHEGNVISEMPPCFSEAGQRQKKQQNKTKKAAL